MKITQAITTVAVALAMLAHPAAAIAAGTGDDPRPTHDVPTENNVRVERDYQAWLRRQGGGAKGTLAAKPTAIDDSYFYFYTPTHYQGTAYYCGPASVQTIDDYWGTASAQATIAKYLGTTSAGTDFSKVDNAINYYASQNYVYYSPCSTRTDFVNRVSYGIATRRHPIVLDLKIDGGEMGNYRYDHDGHIVPLEAFDWRYAKVRLNDPYDEQDWRTGGGATGGHRLYDYWEVADALAAHFRRAIIY